MSESRIITLDSVDTEVHGHFLEPGDTAPNFSLMPKFDLSSDAPEAPPRVGLSTHEGRCRVLNIVVSLDTPLCALSSIYFDTLAKTHKGTVFYVISADSVFAQDRVMTSLQLDRSAALSTVGTSFARDFGVLIGSGPLKGLCARAVVVLDRMNKVVYSELVPELLLEPDYEKAMMAVVQEDVKNERS